MIHDSATATDTGAIIAFGSSDALTPANGSNIPAGLSGADNMAFSVPLLSGALNRLTVFFHNLANVVVPAGSTLNIIAEMYLQTNPASNSFVPVGAPVTFTFSQPGGTILVANTFMSGTSTPVVNVQNQNRLLLVIRITVTGTDVPLTVIGKVSAGLAILVP